MKLTFIGADHEVTGSCHFLEACGKHILVDCGMEQGPNVYENHEIPVPAAQIDYVLLTHAHIDHAGLLPLLYAHGFRGKIYTTAATKDLAGIMLRDSAHIQMFEAEWRNRKARRSGREPYVPLYTMEDAEGVMPLFCGVAYGEKFPLCDGIEVRFTDAGHLLGSASVEVWLQEGDVQRKIVFSGDIGNLNQPLIKDPQYIDQADYVVMESTYGNRRQGEPPDYVGELARIIQETFDKGGNLVIPSFAVGRTQELLYFLRIIKQEGRVRGHDGFEVYVDSPLAVEATHIFSRNVADCFDEEAMDLVSRGINPTDFAGLRLCITSDQSREINFDPRPKVILSASGMCEAGRIRHHLKHNLWRPECTVLFVGYQAYGTLGRAIQEGAEEVKLFGEPVEVRARILTLSGMSGHADQAGLIRWVTAFSEKPRRVFVVHGEDAVCDSFSALLREEYGLSATAPYSGTVYDLAADVCLESPPPVRVVEKPAARKASPVYARLLSAGQRLQAVILHNEGGANKDLAKFADQILALCDKWDR